MAVVRHGPRAGAHHEQLGAVAKDGAETLGQGEGAARPPGTFWKALSGQLANQRSRAFWLAPDFLALQSRA